jgi:GT2 family glycosyltransferase
MWKLLKHNIYLQRYIIKKSGLFDERYYLKSYPDVRLGDIDPIIHYIKYGAREGRNPNPYFDTTFYLNRYEDVAKSKINPLLHYILYGAKEGRWAGPNFNSGFYLLSNPDVKKAGLNPLLHYIRYGQYEGRKTNLNNEYRLLAVQNEPTKLIRILRLINKTNVKKGIYYIRKYGLKAFLNKIKTKLNSMNSDLQAYEESYKNIFDVINLLLPEPFIPRIEISEPIDILIPVYNGREFLDSLFGSIIKNTSVPYRLLIANDKSTDPGISKYLADFKNSNPNIDITVIENEDNLGFVKTVNKLAKLTKNHFVILNTDTEVPPHWLERLIFPIISKEDIASVTPFTNSGTICSFPEFLVDNPMFEGMDVATLDSYFQYVDFEKNYVEIPTAVGFCMAINKKVYDKIGLFDEIFGKGYGEENDWSMRAAKAGYKNIIAPNLFVYHKHGGSFKSEEKKKLMDHNFALLRDKHPNYFLLVEDFIRKDPLKHLRSILKIRILSKLYKPIMIFDHSLGGGANEYTNDFVKDKNLVIILRYDFNRTKYIIEFLGKKIEKLSFEIYDIKDIEKIIFYFNIEEIIINELVSYPKILDLLDFLIKLKKNNKNINFTFNVHDYYCICPMYNLLNYEIKYCNIPSNLALCDECILKNKLIETEVPFVKHDYPNLKISLWREKFNELLKHSSKIVCFSNSSKDIIQKTYKNLSVDVFEVKPHIVDWVRPVTIKKTSETINIAILGNLGIHKGAYIVSSLASYIDYHNLNLKIHIFGNVFEPYESFYSNKSVVKHGGYKKNNLPKLMEENEIDIIFIPSIWPETFSYTTEEAIKMDMPVAVFDLGAPAERVKNYSKGIILEKQDPEYIINKFFNFLKHNYNPNLTLDRDDFSIKI